MASAKRALEQVARSLEEEHPGAAASIREGLDETLTVLRLGLTGSLQRTLRTTNIIENLNSGVERYTRNVKRWRGGQMIQRWERAPGRRADSGAFEATRICVISSALLTRWRPTRSAPSGSCRVRFDRRSWESATREVQQPSGQPLRPGELAQPGVPLGRLLEAGLSGRPAFSSRGRTGPRAAAPPRRTEKTATDDSCPASPRSERVIGFGRNGRSISPECA